MKKNIFPICMLITTVGLIFVLVMQFLDCRAYSLF
jgi:hypothetical protein